jgi:hypothetical protein
MYFIPRKHYITLVNALSVQKPGRIAPVEKHLPIVHKEADYHANAIICYLVYTIRIISVSFTTIAAFTKSTQITHFCFSALGNWFDMINFKLCAICCACAAKSTAEVVTF